MSHAAGSPETGTRSGRPWSEKMGRAISASARESGVGGGEPWAELYLEHVGHDGAVVAGPRLLHQVRVGLGDLPLHAQRVAEVELLQVAVFEEVLGELRHVAEALQEAGASQGNEEESAVTRVGQEDSKRAGRRKRGERAGVGGKRAQGGGEGAEPREGRE